MLYYFVRTPKLPKEVAHHSGAVQVLKYATEEGESVMPGQTIVILENWWARMALKAVCVGNVSKTFFPHGASVAIGDPLAIVICDGENAPGGDESCKLEIIEYIRQKPIH